MQRSCPVDGFRLAYDRSGSGAGVLLLHGWPGTRLDYRDVVPLLSDAADVVAPDLRGFGESDKHRAPPAEAYSADAQARRVARLFPERVRALVLSPPLPGAGDRVLTPQAQREFWYQAFHQLKLVEEIIDGHAPAVRSYLGHFWSHWSGPSFEQPAAELDRLADLYRAPGAFISSIAWYRAGSGTVATSLREMTTERHEQITVPTAVLWPEFDPLFPQDWRDRLDAFFADVTVTLLPGVGHFIPREAPRELAMAIRSVLAYGSVTPQ
jgi:pimeloyl-ACP methyl ester carboxylesterase